MKGVLSGALLVASLSASLLTCLGAGARAAAPGAKNADWPCAQPRTPTISAATVWAGPEIDKSGPWDQDREAAELAQKLASRRTPLADVDGLLDEFVTKAGADKGADKDVELTRVFAGVLELVNAQRDRVIAGIVNYAHGQNERAAKVRADSELVADRQEAAAPQQEQEEAETSLKWDKRIFEERAKSLTYVCETPALLERRVFEIARRIQQKL